MISIIEWISSSCSWCARDDAQKDDNVPVEKAAYGYGGLLDLYGCERLRMKYISNGGSSSVFRWTVNPKNSTGFEIALKRTFLLTERARICYKREVEILRILHGQDRIVRIDQSWIKKGRSLSIGYITMELCRGGDMFDYIQTNGRIPEHIVSIIVKRLVTVLGRVHRLGIAHRDVKLENIFLKTRNDPTDIVLGDFGLSFREGYRPIPNESVVGTKTYVAPEIVTESMFGKQCTTRSLSLWQKADVWSVGVCTFMLLTGVSPHRNVKDHRLFSHIADFRQQNIDSAYPSDVYFALSDTAKDFVRYLLQPISSRRPSTDDVCTHSFLNN